MAGILCMRLGLCNKLSVFNPQLLITTCDRSLYVLTDMAVDQQHQAVWIFAVVIVITVATKSVHWVFNKLRQVLKNAADKYDITAWSKYNSNNPGSCLEEYLLCVLQHVPRHIKRSKFYWQYWHLQHKFIIQTFRSCDYLMNNGIEFPLLSHAKIESSSYGCLTIIETSPKKLCRSVIDGWAEPLGWEWTIPT